MTHPPATGQKKLPVDRGNQLKLLRLARTGGTPYKAMLFALDSRIGREKGEWEMSYAELGEDIEVSESSAYRIASALKKANLINAVKMGNKRAKFSIRWDTLWQEYGPQVQPLESKTTVVKSANSVRESANEIRESDNSVREFENAPIKPNKITQPPSTPSSGPERQMVMMKLKEAGIVRIAEALEKALAAGNGFEQIAAVIDHYQAHPGRWNAGILFDRLTQNGSGLLAPAEGWYGDSPAWKDTKHRQPVPAQSTGPHPLEAKYGSALDAMDEAELDNLTAEWTKRDRLEFKRFDRNHPDFRPRLLAEIAKRDRPSITSQEFPTGEPSHAIPPPITRPQELTAAT